MGPERNVGNCLVVGALDGREQEVDGGADGSGLGGVADLGAGAWAVRVDFRRRCESSAGHSRAQTERPTRIENDALSHHWRSDDLSGLVRFCDVRHM